VCRHHLYVGIRVLTYPLTIGKVPAPKLAKSSQKRAKRLREDAGNTPGATCGMNVQVIFASLRDFPMYLTAYLWAGGHSAPKQRPEQEARGNA
jgi:hypothetical protein